MEHEAKAGNQIGGHTLLKHVGKDKAWLQARLAREPRLEMVTSFHNREMAEWAISQVMQQKAVEIRAWAQASNGAKRLPLAGETGRAAGHGLVRETGQMIEPSKVQMFLRKEQYNGMPYYLITAYLIK
ncbi:RNase A-like domain-containing protein [Paraburkholderia sp. J12]|uniref:RNase A-like domain-containing protein n=1 Tax=Paraburkholderia sp. J12 TaxID=2805432 RepID=UPI002ABDD2F9|nr:RNase A-like domain-containing protein [Paraburkholderia sp. J12]